MGAAQGRMATTQGTQASSASSQLQRSVRLFAVVAVQPRLDGAQHGSDVTCCQPRWGSKTPIHAKYYFMHQHRCDEKLEDARQALLVDTPPSAVGS